MTNLSHRSLRSAALLASVATAALAGAAVAADDGVGFHALVAAAVDSTAHTIAFIEAPPPRDGLSPEQAAEIERAIADFDRRHPLRAAAKDDGPPRFPFYPQAGVLGRDLFLNNFTDQDPAAGQVRDWDCSQYTYDGHQGHDSLVRSFREQAVGVPVFAVAPGIVVDAHDGEPDMNTEWNPANRANYVIVDHGGGWRTLYLHFKIGSVAVVPEQEVTAGTQLGLTGSSGISDWPHLHLETRRDNRWLEPSAGPCSNGESLWTAQPPVVRDPYVADFYLSRGPLPFVDYESYMRDEATRAGSFVKGRQLVGVRVDLRNVPASSSYRLRVLDPQRKVELELAGALTRNAARLWIVTFHLDLDLDTVGTWRLLLEADGFAPLDAPFKVVAGTRQLVNRRPAKVTARLAPAKPVEGEAMTCTVQTSLVAEDPDYDLVAYRYDWRIGSRLARSVTSAASTDMLAVDVAQPGDKVSCKVTPTDVKSFAAGAAALPADEL